MLNWDKAQGIFFPPQCLQLVIKSTYQSMAIHLAHQCFQFLDAWLIFRLFTLAVICQVSSTQRSWVVTSAHGNAAPLQRRRGLLCRLIHLSDSWRKWQGKSAMRTYTIWPHIQRCLNSQVFVYSVLTKMKFQACNDLPFKDTGHLWSLSKTSLLTWCISTYA